MSTEVLQGLEVEQLAITVQWRRRYQVLKLDLPLRNLPTAATEPRGLTVLRECQSTNPRGTMLSVWYVPLTLSSTALTYPDTRQYRP